MKIIIVHIWIRHIHVTTYVNNACMYMNSKVCIRLYGFDYMLTEKCLTSKAGHYGD